MSVLYFAKLNFNSNIYDLYKDKEKYYKLLNEVYCKLDVNRSIIDDKGDEYKFNSLIRNNNNMTIVGRLSKIFHGNVEKYDREKDQPASQPESDLSSSISFYFDVNKEIIAYTISAYFKYRMFLAKFKELLELYIPEVEFEIILLNNIGDLKRKIESLKVINEVTITLLPPNPPNIEEFKDIFGEDRADEILEAGGTKYTEKIEIQRKKGKSIILGKLFEKAYKAINKGYGSIVTKGLTQSDQKTTVSSVATAPLVRPIDDEQKNNLIYIEERGRHYINIISTELSMIEINKSKIETTVKN